MIFYIASDHGGYEMKNELVKFLKDKGYQVEDLGPDSFNKDDDYPDYAAKVASKVSLEYESSRGIVICKSGVGVDVVANKFEKVRCALGFNSNQVYDSRNDDDSNILALPSNYVDIDTAKNLTLTWIETPFSADARHKRRLNKIFQLESLTSKDIKQSDF